MTAFRSLLSLVIPCGIASITPGCGDSKEAPSDAGPTADAGLDAGHLPPKTDARPKPDDAGWDASADAIVEPDPNDGGPGTATADAGDAAVCQDLLNDVHNCGECGRDCGPTACHEGRCDVEPVALTRAPTLSPESVPSEVRVLFAAGGFLYLEPDRSDVHYRIDLRTKQLEEVLYGKKLRVSDDKLYAFVEPDDYTFDLYSAPVDDPRASKLIVSWPRGSFGSVWANEFEVGGGRVIATLSSGSCRLLTQQFLNTSEGRSDSVDLGCQHNAGHELLRDETGAYVYFLDSYGARLHQVRTSDGELTSRDLARTGMTPALECIS